MKRNPVFLGTVLGIALCACASGCGYDKVELKVMQEGKPVAGAMVVLASADGSTQLAPSGLTNAEGVCSISTLGKPGAPRGSYKALVTQSPVSEDPNPNASLTEKFAIRNKQELKDGPQKRQQSDTNTLPAKYAKIETTTLTVTVPTSGIVTLTLEADK